ncbi:MAG: hypothetical protein V4616_02045 [Bacteroidota bacterium]
MRYVSIFLALAFLAGACTNDKKAEQEKSAKPDHKYPQTEKVFYPTGEIKMAGKLKDGKRQGPWSSWFQNGKINSEANFVNDQMDGKYTVWYENGQERITGNYKLDKEIGTWYFFAENGDTITVKDFEK